MKLQRFLLPGLVLGAAAALLVPAERTEAYSIIHGGLGQGARHFRVWNNFTGTTPNNNTTPHPSFPGYLGATMAIWKGCIEWQSFLHGDGQGDPHQPGGLGSGGANFDPSFQGLASNAGTLNGNIHSELSGCSGGVLAFTESPSPSGWRIRYYSCWTWEDGPGTTMPTSSVDLQGVAAHEYGHALGLGHTQVNFATMFASITGTGVIQRSIELDDSNGVKAIYGNVHPAKPRIFGVCINGNQMTINGENFSPSGNQIWFSSAATDGSGVPVKATGLTSNGTTITATIPGTAGPGDVLARNNGTGHHNLSNSWPTDLVTSSGDCGGGDPLCPTPTNYCVAAPNSTGFGMIMSWSGSTCVSDQDFSLEAFGGPPNQLGIFYYGPNQVEFPFGNGFRCVGAGAVGTFRLPIVQIDFFGDVIHTIDWTQPPISSGPGAWVSGLDWNVQFWYRDPAAGGSNFNFSDGLQVILGM